MCNQIDISAQTSELKHVRKFVQSYLNDLSIQGATKGQIILAIDEICANLIIHSNQKNSEKSIKLSLSYDQRSSELQVHIKDHGKIFDYSSYQEPIISQVIESKQKGGIGLYLVRKIMDKIDFLSEGGLNITTLTKKINPSTIVS